MNKISAFLIASLMIIQPVFALEEEDPFSSEDFNLDLPATEIMIDLDSIAPANERDWEIYGFFQAELGHSFDKEDGSPGLAKLRATSNLTFDYKISNDWKFKVNGSGFYDYAYGINGRENYSEEALDIYEREMELRDTYLEGDLGSGVSLKIGRQIIAWGESDSSQVNDMANPRDNREVGMVELEDARIPVTASLISWTKNDWRGDLAAIHEYRANKIAPVGSEFDPLAAVRSNGIDVKEEELPSHGGEWAGRVIKSFNGGDIGIYVSETYNDAFYLDFDSLTKVNGQVVLSLRPKHQKIQSLGFSANKVINSLLIKGEVAHKKGLIFLRSDVEKLIKVAFVSGSSTIDNTLEKDQIQHMLGFEYRGLSDFVLTLEVNKRHIVDWESTISSSENTLFTFASATHTVLNDTLSNRVVWIHYDDQQGDIYRWTAEYDIMDGLNISAGIALYESPKEDSLMESFEKNDRLILSSRYSF